MNLPSNEIVKLINSYKSQINYIGRYSSFDYCYNYFQGFAKTGNITGIAAPKNIELSVLQLGFYLASWGMYRGSTALLRHSSHSLLSVIKFVASTPQNYWSIDIENYSTKLNELEYLYKGIGGAIDIPLVKFDKAKPQSATTVLVTKIMLGIYGNSPALDEFFVTGIGKSTFQNSDYLKSFNKVKIIWKELEAFYVTNNEVIDSYTIQSLGFDKMDTGILYPKAKLIDMIFFEKGNEIKKAEKLNKILQA